MRVVLDTNGHLYDTAGDERLRERLDDLFTTPTARPALRVIDRGGEKRTAR